MFSEEHNLNRRQKKKKILTWRR